jgi:hypothetical protein
MAIDNQTRKANLAIQQQLMTKRSQCHKQQMTDTRDTATRLDVMLRGGASASCLLTDGTEAGGFSDSTVMNVVNELLHSILSSEPLNL